MLKTEPISPTGWLAPSGEFYPCCFGEHEDKAYEITEYLFDNFSGSKELEKLGWIRLFGGEWVSHHSFENSTQAQIDSIQDLISSGVKDSVLRNAEKTLVLLIIRQNRITK